MPKVEWKGSRTEVEGKNGKCLCSGIAGYLAKDDEAVFYPVNSNGVPIPGCVIHVPRSALLDLGIMFWDLNKGEKPQ